MSCITFLVFVGLLSSVLINHVTPYSKISKNGMQIYDTISDDSSKQEARNEQDSLKNVDESLRGIDELNNEGRSVQNYAITVAPKYASLLISKLKPGEAVDHNPIQQPLNLNQELPRKLNGMIHQNQANERYTPPSIFQTGKKNRGNGGMKGVSKPDTSLSQSMYDYSFTDYISESKPKPSASNIVVKESNKNENENSKVPDLGFNSFGSPQDFSNFDGIYEGKDLQPSDYSDHHLDHPPFSNNHHEIIYDHIPDDHHLYHHHHHHDFTTEKPEMMNDQRLSKRPYSYYYIGRKLWYLPLYFSIYFIIYVAALVLKSVARHKINFPANLAAAAADGRSFASNQTSWWNISQMLFETVKTYYKME